MKSGPFYSTILLAGFLLAASIQPAAGQARGSGSLATLEQPFSGFTELEVHHGCRLHLKQGSDFSVVVRIDEDLVDDLRVVQEGSRLSIGMKRGSYSRVHLEADVTMPRLEALELSGGSDGTVSGFSSEGVTKLGLSGGSKLHGDMDTGPARISLSGGSQVNLEGSAGDLQIDASGGSRLSLSGFEARNVKVELSGGSQADINADGTLEGSLSGGSTLYYEGAVTLGSLDKSGGSRAIPR